MMVPTLIAVGDVTRARRGFEEGVTAPVATGYITQLNEMNAAERHILERRRAVKLTPDQIRQFEQEGYFFLPGCFSDEEVAVLRDEADEIYKSDRPEVWRE